MQIHVVILHVKRKKPVVCNKKSVRSNFSMKWNKQAACCTKKPFGDGLIKPILNIFIKVVETYEILGHWGLEIHCYDAW